MRIHVRGLLGGAPRTIALWFCVLAVALAGGGLTDGRAEAPPRAPYRFVLVSVARDNPPPECALEHAYLAFLAEKGPVFGTDLQALGALLQAPAFNPQWLGAARPLLDRVIHEAQELRSPGPPTARLAGFDLAWDAAMDQYVAAFVTIIGALDNPNIAVLGDGIRMVDRGTDLLRVIVLPGVAAECG